MIPEPMIQPMEWREWVEVVVLGSPYILPFDANKCGRDAGNHSGQPFHILHQPNRSKRKPGALTPNSPAR